MRSLHNAINLDRLPTHYRRLHRPTSACAGLSIHALPDPSSDTLPKFWACPLVRASAPYHSHGFHLAQIQDRRVQTPLLGVHSPKWGRQQKKAVRRNDGTTQAKALNRIARKPQMQIDQMQGKGVCRSAPVRCSNPQRQRCQWKSNGRETNSEKTKG